MFCHAALFVAWDSRFCVAVPALYKSRQGSWWCACVRRDEHAGTWGHPRMQTCEEVSIATVYSEPGSSSTGTKGGRVTGLPSWSRQDPQAPGCDAVDRHRGVHMEAIL